MPRNLRAKALAALLIAPLALALPLAASGGATEGRHISLGWGTGVSDQRLDSGFTSSYGVGQFEEGDFPFVDWRLDLEISGLSLARSPLAPTLFFHTGFHGHFGKNDGGHVTNVPASRPPTVVADSTIVVDWYAGPGLQLSLPLPLVKRRLRVKPSLVLGLQHIEGRIKVDESALIVNGGRRQSTKSKTFFYLGPELELNVPVVSGKRFGISAFVAGNASFFVADRDMSVAVVGQAGQANYAMQLDRFAWATHAGFRLHLGIDRPASRIARRGD